MALEIKPSTLHVTPTDGEERIFTNDFRIGRGDKCDLVLESGLVSRIHARVNFLNGSWRLIDEGSTNGTYLNGSKIITIQLTSNQQIQFGINGPILEFRVNENHDIVQAEDDESTQPEIVTGGFPQIIPPKKSTPAPPETIQETSNHSHIKSPLNPVQPGENQLEVPRTIQHYFGETDTPAGSQTQFIRSAYQAVQAQQKRRFTRVIITFTAFCLFILAFAYYQYDQRKKLESFADMYFKSQKQIDLQIVSLTRSIEASGIELDDQLHLLRKERRENEDSYRGYIKELGLSRKLTEKEQAIYDVARIFNESEFGMPATFVGEVLEKINTFWLARNKDRLIQGIHRAEQRGYTSYIVEALTQRGLPPEFFYLALQESDLRVDQFGPRTRWGIAKGMWQFIPSTATRFGLRTGPRVNQRVYDPKDERHDFYKSTDAAARYLQEIYTTLAQASGLLVMASYNWGEHRISDKLPGLEGKRPIREEIFAGIPEDPEHRNYWLFLTQYKNRMPEETQDYVLKIFAAAVIGHNPRLWGLEMDNPLQKHLEGN